MVNLIRGWLAPQTNNSESTTGIFNMFGHFRKPHLLSLAVAFGLVFQAIGVSQAAVQCFSLEFFYDAKSASGTTLQSALKEFAAERTGLQLYFHDVSDDKDQAVKKRIDSITKYFSLSEVKLPAIYGLKNILTDLKSEMQMRSRLEQILTLTAFVRNGCPHCRDAKAFLRKYRSRYPALNIVYREVTQDRSATDDMYALASRYGQAAASLPVIHFCNGLSIGFDRDATTGRRILQQLDYWSKACPVEKKK